MHHRLKNQFAFLGLLLGMLVLATSVPARAEPAESKKMDKASEHAKASPSEGTTQKQVRTVVLPADVGGKSRVNRPLLLTSSALFAVGYIPAAITALANSEDTSGWLGAPVVGPWIDWGPHTSPGNKVLLFASGLFQAVGVAGIVTSFFVPERKTERLPLMGKRRVHLAPVAHSGSYLLSASGTF